MEPRISQWQAMRSIFGRERVTQTVRPRASRFGILSAETVGNPACFQRTCPLSRILAVMLLWRSQPGLPSLSFFVLVADDPCGLAGETPRPDLNFLVGTAACVRYQPGLRREVVVYPDIDQGRHAGCADESWQFV
jgi:hypothetical protein